MCFSFTVSKLDKHYFRVQISVLHEMKYLLEVAMKHGESYKFIADYAI